jgi:long-subunit acyl-CoA synthetase (AMP-forming)
MYTTNSLETCEYTIRDSSSQIVVVENKTQLDKILPLKEKLNLKAIIQYTGAIADDKNGFVKSVGVFYFSLNETKNLLSLYSSGRIL